MVKEAPSAGRMIAMIAFALSCVGILLYLWLVFGGSVPAAPRGLSLRGQVPRGHPARPGGRRADLGRERGQGQDEGARQRDRASPTTVIEIDDQLRAAARRTPRRSCARRRLLGETYVELSPGNREGNDMLATAAACRPAQVSPTVELDEIFRAFDPQDAHARSQTWLAEQGRAVERRRPGPERRAGRAHAVRRGRGRRAEDPRRAGAGHARPGARHGRRVRAR